MVLKNSGRRGPYLLKTDKEMQKLDRVMDGDASNGVSNVMPGASLQGQGRA